MTGAERGYTPEQIAANRKTHTYKAGRCIRCDCRPVHDVAQSACGDEPPRVPITDEWLERWTRR